MIWLAAPLAILLVGQTARPIEEPPKELILAGDNIEIASDTKVKPGTYLISDIDDNGVIHVKGDNITVDFQGAELIGIPETRTPDTYVGKGIVISGHGVTVRDVKIRGFKLGIYAVQASGLTIEDADVSGNFRQRLKSTPRREDGGDWLSPHQNDQGQWVSNYGAGLYVAHSEKVTLRRVRARDVQNGIVLDRVNDSRIYDNDCSFLSGWGLALWRCSRNLISRNAFDFCVRGYSHDVYNRGQDSAGILMFEQNNENVIADNSATHCGDGLFGFGGVESLAGTGRTGNNGNLIVNNDFSYAVAHGVEMTFSFDNQIVGNRLAECGICGVWAGYSQGTLIAGNTFVRNGQAGYGPERGGVNIEHGRGNVIKYNTFVGNECGVFLWSDTDERLAGEPWVEAHDRGSTDNLIAFNGFETDKLAVQLRESLRTTLTSNATKDVGRVIDADVASTPIEGQGGGEMWRLPKYTVEGATFPIDARRHLEGRHRIVMTEWGPCDFREYALLPERFVGGHQARVQVVGPSGSFRVREAPEGVTVSPTTGDIPGSFIIERAANGVGECGVTVDVPGRSLQASGTLARTPWNVQWFAWDAEHDPRQHPDKWKELIEATPLATANVPSVEFHWGGSAPAEGVPADRFGTVATTTIDLPDGYWTVRAVSDDGVRVWIDERQVIDNWRWHPPTEDMATIRLPAGDHHIRIEHFDIDGHAQLDFLIEPAAPEPRTFLWAGTNQCLDSSSEPPGLSRRSLARRPGLAGVRRRG